MLPLLDLAFLQGERVGTCVARGPPHVRRAPLTTTPPHELN
jgi:hypothetical protein